MTTRDNAALDLGDMGELPDVDSVVNALAEQGITSFSEDEDSADQYTGDIEGGGVQEDPPELGQADVLDEADPTEGEGDGEGEDAGVEEDGGDDSVEQPEDSAPEPDETKRSSRDYADLVARQRELDQRELDFRERANKEDSEVAQLRQQIEELRGQSPKRPRTPQEALKAAGFSYDDATKEQLGSWEGPEPEPELTPEQKKISELEQQVQDLLKVKKEEEARKTQEQYEAVKAQMIGDIEQVAKDEGFEYIASMGNDAFEYVNQVMVAFYQKYNQALDISQACDIVEKEYEKEFLGRLAKSRKFQETFLKGKEEEKPAKSETKPPKVESKGSSKTLKRSKSSGTRVKPKLDELPPHIAQEEVAKMLIFHDD